MSSLKLKHSSGNGTVINAPAANPSADITLKVPSTTGSAGQVLKVASANHSSTNAELEWAADSGGLFSAWAQVYDLAGSTGADGGTFTSGAMRTRVLNTEEDPSNIVSLSSNQFTLGAGTYIIRWSAPAYEVSQHVTQLYDITGSAVAARGSQAYSYYASDVSDSRSVGIARVTITGDTAYEIQHQAGMTQNTNGFGPGMGGQLYKFTIVEILKEA